MELFALPNILRRARLSLDDICSIIGMAALWMSVFKRMLYPVIHTYLRTGNEAALSAQGVYAAVLLCTTLALALALGHARLGKAILERRWPVVLFGIGGAIGLAILSLDLFPAGAEPATIIAAGVLVALYIPIHLAFWILRLHAQCGSGATETSSGFRNAAASIALFIAAYALLALCGAQNSYVSIACPLISSAMACIVSKPVFNGNAAAVRGEGPAGEAESPGPAITSRSSVSSRAVAGTSTLPAMQEGVFAPPAIQTGASARSAAQAEASAQLAAKAEASARSAMQTGALDLPAAQAKPSMQPAAQAKPSMQPTWIEKFAEQFELSERETELAAYTYRNYSARKISGELFIAESTVYTHQKRIYRKTGVHSKQELIELIDAWRADEGPMNDLAM